MSKKKLDTVGILNELTGKSRFFESPIQDNQMNIPEKKSEPPPPDDNHATTTPCNHDTVVPRYHDTAAIEVDRRALNSPLVSSKIFCLK